MAIYSIKFTNDEPDMDIRADRVFHDPSAGLFLLYDETPTGRVTHVWLNETVVHSIILTRKH